VCGDFYFGSSVGAETGAGGAVEQGGGAAGGDGGDVVSVLG